MTIGRREFAPSLLMTALAAILFASFLSLGRWQWSRYENRQVVWEQFARGADDVQSPGTRSLAQLARFQHIELHGSFDTQRQFLLDNRIHEGRAGYEVLTPFRLADGRTVLVDRGWLPFTGRRDQLPDVTLQDAANTSIRGRVEELPVAGLERGRMPPRLSGEWPRVTSFPHMTELATALGMPLEPRLVLLDAEDPRGYVRRWQPPGVNPATHWSYAIQWWCFAAVLLILYVALNLRKIER